MALESMGARCVFSSEIDKFARAVYKENYGELPSGDITKIHTKDIPDFDILCPAPYYLCVVSDSHEMEKFDIDLMSEQTETFAKLIEKIEKIYAKDLGRSDGYSIIKAKSVSGGYDFTLKGLTEKISSKIKK